MGFVIGFISKKHVHVPWWYMFADMLFSENCINCNMFSCVAGAEDALLKKDDPPVVTIVTTQPIRKTCSVIRDMNDEYAVMKKPDENISQSMSFNDVFSTNAIFSSTRSASDVNSNSGITLSKKCSRCSYNKCKCITELYGTDIYITHTRSYDDVRRYKDPRDSPDYQKMTKSNPSRTYVGHDYSADGLSYM